MLVYLMGIADIFAAIMLVTGFKPSIIMAYVFAVLLIKGAASFWKNFNPMLYVLGAADLLAIVLLWNVISLGSLGTAVIAVMVLKGFISFWNLDALRNGTFWTAYAAFSVLTFGLVKMNDRTKAKEKFVNFFWVGSNNKKFERYRTPEIDYPKPNKKPYPYLEKLN